MPGEQPDERVADLHLHTTASDGQWAPSRIVAKLAELGFAAAAITDHDEVGGIPEAIEAGKSCGVEVIPAVELSTALPVEAPTRRSRRTAAGDKEIHILGYFIDCQAPELLEVLEACRTHRRRRMHDMVEQLGEIGLSVDVERVRQLAGEGAIGRPHLARAMIEAGHVRSVEEAFARYLSPGRPGHAPKWRMTPAEACALVRRIGGVPVLAHPMLLKDDQVVASIIDDGVLGLEAYYSYIAPQVTERYIRMADEAGLVVTGGSDCHQAGAELAMGRVRLPYERVDALRERWESLRRTS